MNKEAWERLSAFESHDLVRTFYEQRHALPLKAKKATEITASLAQGRQFFEAAGFAGELARPLLLYYGVLSLCRGLILFLDTTAQLSTLSQAHGIESKGWSNELLAFGGGATRIPALRIEINGSGTFGQLAEATQNDERWRVFSHDFPDEIRGLTHGSSTLVSSTLTADDVLSRIPDLKPLYERTFVAESRCHISFIMAGSPGSTTIEVLDLAEGPIPLVELGKLIALPPNVPTTTAQISNAGAQFFRHQEQQSGANQVTHVMLTSTSFDDLQSHLANVKNDRHGNMLLISPLPDGTILSTLSLYFLNTYILGMIVRYYPTVWQSLVSRESGDRAFPLLKTSLGLIQDRFPQLIADELEDLHPKFPRIPR